MFAGLLVSRRLYSGFEKYLHQLLCIYIYIYIFHIYVLGPQMLFAAVKHVAVSRRWNCLSLDYSR